VRRKTAWACDSSWRDNSPSWSSDAEPDTGLNSGRSEGLNGKIRTITRRSFAFHSASSLIALIHLCCGGLTLSPVHR
jgi:hypothetical protein